MTTFTLNELVLWIPPSSRLCKPVITQMPPPCAWIGFVHGVKNLLFRRQQYHRVLSKTKLFHQVFSEPHLYSSLCIGDSYYITIGIVM